MGKPAKDKLPVFMRVQIGTYKNIGSLRNALEEAGHSIAPIPNDMLNKITLAQQKKRLDLVVLHLSDLGFPRYAEVEQIYKAALDRGLELCPAEVGPQLRLKYTDQPDLPSDHWFHIAMEPINNYHFTLGRYQGINYLNCRGCNQNFESFCRFVFVQSSSLLDFVHQPKFINPYA